MYFRYANKNNKINPITGFAMFSNNENRVSECYGDIKYTYDGTDGVKIEDMKNRFYEAWEDCKYNAPEYMWNLTADEFFNAFNPSDIVNDAEAWDNDDFRRFFSEFVYDDEVAIILDNGAIVFDDKYIL